MLKWDFLSDIKSFFKGHLFPCKCFTFSPSFFAPVGGFLNLDMISHFSFFTCFPDAVIIRHMSIFEGNKLLMTPASV